jgi:DNA-binding response OmpR family regulator
MAGRDLNDALGNARVLVVEDETLLALDLELTLTAGGCRVLGPVGTVDAAIEAVARDTPDAAVLDLNLNGHSSVPVADALADRAVPFVFVTGYDRDHLPDRHRGAPMVTKPYRPGDILRLLGRALGYRAVPSTDDHAATSGPPAP